MAATRATWTAAFGAKMVARLSGRFLIENGKAWHFGRYLLKIGDCGGDQARILIVATEKALVGRRGRNAGQRAAFDYNTANDPYAAAEIMIEWLQSRDGDHDTRLRSGEELFKLE